MYRHSAMFAYLLFDYNYHLAPRKTQAWGKGLRNRCLHYVTSPVEDFSSESGSVKVPFLLLSLLLSLSLEAAIGQLSTSGKDGYHLGSTSPERLEVAVSSRKSFVRGRVDLS